MPQDSIPATYRVWRYTNSEPFALLPTVPDEQGTGCLAYSGSTGLCGVDYLDAILNSRPATADEIASLLPGLRATGYRIHTSIGTPAGVFERLRERLVGKEYRPIENAEVFDSFDRVLS